MKAKCVFFLLLCATLLSGCSDSNNTAKSNTENEQSTVDTSIQTTTHEEYVPLLERDIFTQRDKEIGYDESTATTINFQDSAISASDTNVGITDSVVTISQEGTYILTGAMSNGQVRIDASDTTKIQLVLQDLTLNNTSSAPIYVKQADKVYITLATGTTNTLSTTGEYEGIDENNIDSVIFSKDDLTINGEGSLSITNAYGNGITSKDSLICTGGTFTITTSGHGMEAKDSIGIASGTYHLDTQKDGLHCENTDDTTKGYIYIANGDFTVNSVTDALDSSNILQIDNGSFTLTTGGGIENAPVKVNTDMKMQHGQETTTSTTDITTDATTTPSAKALKAQDTIALFDGTFHINSSDDSLHSNNDVLIQGGTLTIKSGDDGIHGDSNVTISDGSITIENSYEGIEGQSINIKGGTIVVTSSDDGLNAAGGNDTTETTIPSRQDPFASDESAYIEISGGKLTIIANGDGVDSNGDLLIHGGTTYVSGPENGGNGALDYNGTGTITGGIFIASGSSAMAMNFSDTSTQGSMLVTTQSTQTQEILLKDSSNNLLASYIPVHSYNSVVISVPELIAGETYEVTMGSETQTIEMTSLLYGVGHSMGGGKGNRGDKTFDGTRPEKGTKPEGATPPEGGTAPNGDTPPEGMTPPSEDTPPEGLNGVS